MKNNKIWRIIAVICLILGIATLGVSIYTGGRTESVEQVDISTANKNAIITYDNENGIMYTGSQEGILAAWNRDGDNLWTAKSVGGEITGLEIGQAGDKLYVGSQNNHFYVFQAIDGTQIMDVNTERKIVGITVNSDESKIAVITNTGASKSNLLIYTAKGELIANNAYTTEVLRGVHYCENGQDLIVAVKKGEVRCISENGEVLGIYRSGYEVKQMQYVNGDYWIICRDGGYHQVSEDLQLIRKGKIANNIGAIPIIIGVDAEGKYVMIGSAEGYIFVMDDNDQQVYMADFGVKLTDTAFASGEIYFTGYSDTIRVIYTDKLANAGLYTKLTVIMRTISIIAFVVLVIALAFGLEKTRKASIKLLKNIWKNRYVYLMLVPIFTLLFFFSYRGIFIGLTRAFTNWSVDNYYTAEMDFVGLDNFRAMIEEGYFLVGIKNLAILIIINVIKTLTMPLIVAWMLFSIKSDKWKYIHRFLFILPIVVPAVVTTLVWQKIYDPNIGLLNQLLGLTGLESLQRVWLGDTKTALWAILAVGFPYVGAMQLLVYYGGFLNIGEDIIESAKIDGAGRWKIFWRIQIPLIKPQMSLLLTLCFLGSMQEFNTFYLMTGGGPGTATYVPALELYLNVAQYGRYGYASAMGVVLLIFTLMVTVIGNVIKAKDNRKV